jgi:hypothetical protein
MEFATIDLMTLPQMVEEFRLRATQVAEIDARRRALLVAIEQRKARVSAEARVRMLTEDEKAALRAALEMP